MSGKLLHEKVAKKPTYPRAIVSPYESSPSIGQWQRLTEHPKHFVLLQRGPDMHHYQELIINTTLSEPYPLPGVKGTGTYRAQRMA